MEHPSSAVLGTWCVAKDYRMVPPKVRPQRIFPAPEAPFTYYTFSERIDAFVRDFYMLGKTVGMASPAYEPARVVVL